MLVAEGLRTRPVRRAAPVGPVAASTVKQHGSSIFRKRGARNRAEAVRLADDLGLI